MDEAPIPHKPYLPWFDGFLAESVRRMALSTLHVVRPQVQLCEELALAEQGIDAEAFKAVMRFRFFGGYVVGVLGKHLERVGVSSNETITRAVMVVDSHFRSAECDLDIAAALSHQNVAHNLGLNTGWRDGFIAPSGVSIGVQTASSTPIHSQEFDGCNPERGSCRSHCHPSGSVHLEVRQAMAGEAEQQ